MQPASAAPGSCQGQKSPREPSAASILTRSLSPLPGKDPGSVAYGFLPPAFFRAVRDRFLEARRRQIAALVQRTE